MLDVNKLKIMNCSSCGGELEIKNQRTKYVSCQYCGTTSDISGTVTNIKKGDPNQFKARSFLKIGMIGNFGGVAFQIIGRTCWFNDYMEWDREDRQYYKEKWTFDEWTLLSNDGTYKTIIEDEEGYKVAETQIPKFPNLPNGEKNTIEDFQTGKNVMLSEFGKSTIQYFEGESTYLIQIGDFSQFAQYNSDAAHIVEWRYFDNNEIKEIEFFKETKVHKDQLLKAFLGNSEIKTIKAQRQRTKNENKLKGMVFLVFGIINLLVGIYFINAGGGHVTLLNENFTIDSNNWKEKNSTTLFQDKTIEKKFTIVQDYDAPNISINTDCSFVLDSVELKSELCFFHNKKDTLGVVDDFFYSYNGTDSIASKNNEKHSFSVLGIEEPISTKLHLEIPKELKMNAQGISLNYAIQKEGVVYGSGASFSFMFGLVLIVVGFIVRKK